MKKISLEEYLEKKNIKPAVFAAHLGVTERSVYNYMRGKLPQRKIEDRITKLTGGKVILL